MIAVRIELPVTIEILERPAKQLQIDAAAWLHAILCSKGLFYPAYRERQRCSKPVLSTVQYPRCFTP